MAEEQEPNTSARPESDEDLPVLEKQKQGEGSVTGEEKEDESEESGDAAR